MNLANLRSLGMRSVDVACACGHRASVDVSGLPGEMEVPSIKFRLVWGKSPIDLRFLWAEAVRPRQSRAPPFPLGHLVASAKITRSCVMIGWSGKRRFVAVVRTPASSMIVDVEAKDESSATKALEAQYGTENIIEVRGANGNETQESMSQAEADIRSAVMRGLPKAFLAIATWMLRGALRK